MLELSHMVAAPLAGMVLAQLGAEVVKVEPPDGDPLREFGPPFKGEEAALALTVNRGKRSLCVDLMTEEGSEVVRRAARSADVVLTNYRARALERLRLDHESVHAIAPDALYVQVCAFAGDGWRDRPAVDLTVLGISGLMDASGFPGDPPLRPAAPLADVVTALMTVIAVLGSLGQRDRDPQGWVRFVEVPMTDSFMYACQTLYAGYLADGSSPPRLGNGSPYGLVDCFATVDGNITVAAPSDRLFGRLCEALESPELVERYGRASIRNRERDGLMAELTARFATRTSADWLARLAEAQVPCGPVHSVPAALTDPYVEERNLVATSTHPVLGDLRAIVFPLFAGGHLADELPPLVGEHSRLVLSDLGYSRAEIGQLLASGVVSEGRRTS